MKYRVLISSDNRGYFLKIFRSGKLPLVMDLEIIRYFNLTADFWYSNLLKFNGNLGDFGIYFKNENDALKAKDWLNNNLDYFLMLRKLGGQ